MPRYSLLIVKLPSVSIVMPCVRVAAMMFLLRWDTGVLSERSHAEHRSKIGSGKSLEMERNRDWSRVMSQRRQLVTTRKLSNRAISGQSSSLAFEPADAGLIASAMLA